MPALKVGNPCNDGCFEKIGIETVNEIFHNFLALDSEDDNNFRTSKPIDACLKYKK